MAADIQARHQSYQAANCTRSVAIRAIRQAENHILGSTWGYAWAGADAG